MPTRSARWLLGAALALVSLPVLVIACDSEGTGDSLPTAPSTGSATAPSAPETIVVTPEPLPRGIHLSFIQQRIDEGTRSSQVRVVNGTDRTLRVKTVAIDWAGYPARPNRVDYPVPGQATVDLRYFLPPAVCTAQARRAPIRAVVETGTGRIERPVTADGVRFLTRLWTSECDRRRIDAAVTLGYADRWTREGTGTTSVLHGFLTLDRRSGDRAVDVTQIEGSVLYDLKLADPSRTGLPPGRPRLSVPIDVRSGGRCDPHSRGQSTQTFLFRVFLRLAGGRQIPRLLPPTKPQQRLLLRFLDRACAGSS